MWPQSIQKHNTKMNEHQETQSKLLVRYRNETFDLTQFAHKHPGGKNTLSAALNSDIDYKFETAMPHSPSAKYLLKEYRVSNQVNNNDNKLYSEQLSNGEIFEHKTNGRDNGDHLIKTDDSMEVKFGEKIELFRKQQKRKRE